MSRMVEQQDEQAEGAQKGHNRKPWTLRELGGKTLWDWLNLLIVPAALAVIGFLFTIQQDARQQQIEDRRAQEAQKIENQRAKAERELAEQRAQDEALQAYLDQMSNLLLERNLRESEEDSEVRTLARARTLTVLSRLDSNRKSDVMQFLEEAKLVQRVDGRDPIIGLDGADLSGVNLSLARLFGVDLTSANLTEATLSSARLIDADLNFAELINAELINAKLKNAELFWAQLNNADLYAANLRSADLRLADLRGADLQEANLTNAELTQEQLDQAETLEDVTMPDGQKYEDWLKTPEGQDWLRKYKKNLGAYKKKAGEYEYWIQTTEGQMWLRAVGENSDNGGPS